jgi:Met-10+ like-protein
VKRSALYYALIRLASATLRLYFQYWPTADGKMLLWDRVVRRRIIWRSLPIVARTKFNLTVRGSFPDLIHGYLYFFGVWEPGISRLIARHLQAGNTAIDIGANVGAHTMLAASIVGPKGKVYAVEASPRTFKQLKDNLEYNGLRQVVAINVTVSDRPRTVTVFLQGGSNPGGTTVVPQLVDRDNLAGEVQV